MECFYKKSCSYNNCRKSKKRYSTQTGLRLFRFPLIPELAEQWVVNCGNVDLLNLSTVQLQHKYICEQHFPQDEIVDNCLANGTVPIFYKNPSSDPLAEDHTVFLDCPPTTVKHVYDEHINLRTYLRNKSPQPPRDSDIEIKPLIEAYSDLKETTSKDIKPKNTDYETLLEENARLKERINILTRVQNRQRLQLKELRKTPKTHKKKFISHRANALAKMQVYTRYKIWSKPEMDTALAIYKSSPGAYSEMRRLRIGLPKLQLLKRWVRKNTRFLKGKERVRKQVIKREDVDVDDVILIKSENVQVLNYSLFKDALWNRK